MKEWERVFRTGDLATDWRQAEAWRHEAWQRGVALQSDPLPDGGYRVYPAQTAMQHAGYAAGYAAVHNDGCFMCRRNVPTKHASITWNVGAIAIRFHKTAEGMFCKQCTSSLFWKYTAISFFFGWWGVISFVMTLINIPMNIMAYVSSRSLPDA